MKVVWWEPGPDDKPIKVEVDAWDAVRHQIRVAAARGHRYKDASEALMDFVMVNWAWTED